MTTRHYHCDECDRTLGVAYVRTDAEGAYHLVERMTGWGDPAGLHLERRRHPVSPVVPE